MKAFTPKDRATSAAYRAAQSKQFGDLHERMKYLMDKARSYAEQCRDCDTPHDKRTRMFNDVWQALFDLELEVKYHVPAQPPFGRRVININDNELWFA
jgi:hypothetical protein